MLENALIEEMQISDAQNVRGLTKWVKSLFSNTFSSINHGGWLSEPFSVFRLLSFSSLSHSDNQSQSTTKFYNSFKADVRGNVLTLT